MDATGHAHPVRYAPEIQIESCSSSAGPGGQILAVRRKPDDVRVVVSSVQDAHERSGLGVPKLYVVIVLATACDQGAVWRISDRRCLRSRNWILLGPDNGRTGLTA